jgi:hypothetical protein
MANFKCYEIGFCVPFYIRLAIQFHHIWSTVSVLWAPPYYLDQNSLWHSPAASIPNLPSSNLYWRYSYSSNCRHFYNYLQSNPGILSIVIHRDYPQRNLHIQLVTIQATHSMTKCNTFSRTVPLSKLKDNKFTLKLLTVRLMNYNHIAFVVAKTESEEAAPPLPSNKLTLRPALALLHLLTVKVKKRLHNIEHNEPY